MMALERITKQKRIKEKRKNEEVFILKVYFPSASWLDWASCLEMGRGCGGEGWERGGEGRAGGLG